MRQWALALISAAVLSSVPAIPSAVAAPLSFKPAFVNSGGDSFTEVRSRRNYYGRNAYRPLSPYRQYRPFVRDYRPYVRYYRPYTYAPYPFYPYRRYYRYYPGACVWLDGFRVCF